MTNPRPSSQHGPQLALAHLSLRLRPLQRALQSAVARQKRINAELTRPDIKPLCVSGAQVDQLLTQVNGPLLDRNTDPGLGSLSAEEQKQESRLRDKAAELGIVLPLDAAAGELSISVAETDALLLCAAPELHRAYGRIYAFIQDDLARQLPTLELLCGLTASSDADWLQRRWALGPHGTLRRLKLLLEDGPTRPELNKTFRLAPPALAPLTNPALRWSDQYFDPAMVSAEMPITPDCFGEAVELKRLARSLHSAAINLIGVWGDIGAPVDDAVNAICSAAGLPLRRWLPGDEIHDAHAVAISLGSVLWVDTDRLSDEPRVEIADSLAAALEKTALPVILSGEYPWRPTSLLTARNYAEITLAAPADAICQAQWQQQLPTLDQARAADLARRYRMSVSEQRAAVKTAAVRARLRSNGRMPSTADQLDAACRFVAQKTATRFAKPVIPRRGPDDLVLESDVHAQVLEIPRFYRSLSQVNDRWGFGRMVTGGGGLKALFTGDSGTGKTLAAEVIAGQLDLPLLRIDLAQLVSKWVGETEKNIDAAFREAEACHAMLFFDEADTLFGKRGEIQQGSDRYANLEVGFLLQRLEQFGGLAVLASNLKDEIDEAFVRRFQVLLHFPRPQAAERLRLWGRAFPPDAPLDPAADLTSLANLDLTGAGIMAAGHTAALIAADTGCQQITCAHIAAAISRQFHRESRVLGPNELSNFTSGSALSLAGRGEARPP